MTSNSTGVPRLAPGLIPFGPKSNCNLDLCPIEYFVYNYRPSFPANLSFIVLYAIVGLIHGYLGFRWKTWGFMSFMIVGCINNIIGYVGRLLLWYNPFKFAYFMIQIVCVTTSPVYYCAAIYVTLAAAIPAISPKLSRFNPKLFYWIFIPCDLIALVLQGAGGGLATKTAGEDELGVNLSIAGLAFQVFVLVVFCVLFGDYLVRCFLSGATKPFGRRLQLFFGFMVLAVIMITARCIFRLVELREGFSGKLIQDEALFIGLEGVMILAAVCCLLIAHPGFVFKTNVAKDIDHHMMGDVELNETSEVGKAGKRRDSITT